MGWMELWRVTVMLAFIVAMIYALAWALKRSGGAGLQRLSALRVLATLSLGNREKLYLLQVGNEQLVIGSSSGGLRTLHTLKENVEPPAGAPAAAGSPGFADLLRMIGKGGTP